MNETILFSLDPGLQRTGYAVLRIGASPGADLIESGVLRPRDRDATAPERIEFLCTAVTALLDRHAPPLILVEWDSGHVNVRRHKGGGQGLALHGAVTAALWREALYWARQRSGVAVVTVPENDWTRGVEKEARAIAVAERFPGYDWTLDPGFDAADAIGLAQWHWQEMRVREYAV